MHLHLKKSLAAKLTFANSLIVTAVFLSVGLITVFVSSMFFVSEERQIMEIYIHSALAMVDNKLKDMARVSLIAFSDSTTQDILQNIEQYSDTRRQESLEFLRDLYTRLISIRNDIQGVYLFNEKELVFYQNQMNFTPKTDYNITPFMDLMETIESRPPSGIQNYRLFISGQPDFLWGQPKFSPYSDTYIYIVREVKTFLPNERIGHIALVSPVSVLKETMSDFSFSHFSFVLYVDDGTVMYSDDESFVSKNINAVYNRTRSGIPGIPGTRGSYYDVFQGTRSLISFQTSSYSGVTLAAFVPLSYVYRHAVNLIFIFAPLFAAAVFTVIILTRKYTTDAGRPILLHSETMAKFSRDNKCPPLPVESEDEAGVLTESFNSMITTIKDLIFLEYEKTIEIKNMQLKQKETQLRFLFSQINPHFLYNTLDNIRIRAALAGNQDVADMIMLLVAFFRGNMETSAQFVSIEKELDLTRIYLELFRFRYQNLEIEFNIDKTLLDVEMPSFILQPIVENSLLHGLRSMNYTGKITISLYGGSGGTAVLTVSDNGAGFDDLTREKITKMLEAEDIDGVQSEHHIGIINVAQRLRMFYNDGCGLSYKNNPGGGVTAIITIRKERRTEA
ncbi:MAG: histidine kinase [Treponema sp.]|nr:histidine kinase [Treponema sp.]